MIKGAIRSTAATGRGIDCGSLVSLSFVSFPFSPRGVSLIATGYEGAIVATRGGQGATVPNKESAGV